MSSKVSKFPLIISITVTAVLIAVSLTAGILWASLSINRNLQLDNAGQVATLSATVGSGSITVTNDMDCVMRVNPLATGITFSSTYWTLQDNGWYYYYKVIKANDANKTISLAGANANNVLVELMQAQYSLDSSGAPKGGFILEWASRDMTNSDNEIFGSITSDNLNLGTNPPVIVMFSGHNESRRVPSSEIGANAHFWAEGTPGGAYHVSKISLPGASSITDSSVEAINSSNAITIYNNSTVTMVYTIQVINGGSEPTKASTFDNGNWTTYIDTAPADTTNKWVLASSSGVTSGYSTYFVSRPVAPGQYVDLTNGSDSQLYFGVTETSTPLHFSVSGIDTMSFYNNYLGTPNTDKYLSWLSALDANTAGATTYFSDFEKLLNQSGSSGL